jgi:hypothetical protein
VRNWLFGRYLAHHEHASSDRSKTYGKALIDQVSTQLSALGIKGVAPTNLRQCRSFFQSYSDIHQTLSDESSLADQIEALWSRFTLGWSHYVVLVTIDDPRERSFYEIEAAQNSWGGRELKRQLAASLYERLALGKNQADIQIMAEWDGVVRQGVRKAIAERETDNWATVLYENEFGAFLAVIPDLLPSSDAPAAIKDVHSWALQRGLQWVKFDADASPVSGLPCYGDEESLMSDNDVVLSA